MLGPLYIFPGPKVDGIHCYRLRDAQAEGMPWHLVRPPISLVGYSLGMPWCSTRPPRVKGITWYAWLQLLCRLVCNQSSCGGV